jgi:hypothetical protein
MRRFEPKMSNLRMGCMMRRSTLVLVVTLIASLGAGALVAQSADALMSNMVGTWALNVAKSSYSPGPGPKSNTVKWERQEGGLKFTSDGVDAKGQPTHTELMMKFDGKDYPLKGAPASNTTRSFRRIDDRTYEFVEKVAGKVTTTTRMVASPDRKTRTGTATGRNIQGQVVKNVQVWEKQ